MADRTYTITPRIGVFTPVLVRLVVERAGKICANKDLLLSNLAQAGVNEGHQGGLALTLTANVRENCNKAIATINVFDQE